MLIIILILAAIVLAGLGFGVTIWFAFRNRKFDESQSTTSETRKTENVRFSARYILAPVIILVLSIILTALYYPQLPAQVGYHFKSDGTPDRWFSREMAMMLMLLPQVFLTLLSAGITWGISKMGLLSKQGSLAGIKSEGMLMLMGNVATLPQLVLAFAMLDIFSYNANQAHLLPTWAFILILGLATAALVIVLIYLISRSRKKLIQQSEE